MKYKREIYAGALAQSLTAATTAAGEKKVLASFLKMMVRNGDIGQARRVLDHAERLLAKLGKGDMVVVESARPLKASSKKKIEALFPNAGNIEERILPSLVAGVRVRVNDERELDATLSTRLTKLFSTNY